MDRRTFLRQAAAATALVRAASAQTQDLEEITIGDLAERMRSGQLTARSLAEQYLARIESIDRDGPTLRSVIEINPDALSIADVLDRERKEKGPRGPMHGIPVLIKDNIDTADRMKTTAGSLALADAPQPRDAAVVERLRASGAVILGKTNLSEWANSAPVILQVAGAGVADRHAIPMRSIAIRAAPAPVPARQWRRIFARSR